MKNICVNWIFSEYFNGISKKLEDKKIVYTPAKAIGCMDLTFQ
jgi:hypothetical protein